MPAMKFVVRSWLAVLVGLFLALPVRAETHGGIEIGAKGVKATVLDITPTEDGFELAVKMGETANTALSAGIAKTGSFDPKVVDETATTIKTFFDKMKADHGVTTQRISIVGSSGLFSAIVDKPEAIEANRKMLADAVEKVVGLKMDFVDAKREAELSILGIVPRRHRADSVLIDIGGGNTKGGYIDGNTFATMSVPFGTVTFAEKVKKAEGEFPQAAKELRESLLRPAIKKELAGLKMDKRNRVYLSGGIIWAASTLVHPKESRAFTPLTEKDVDLLLEKMITGKEFPIPDLTDITDEAKRKKAAKEIEKVKGTYPPDQLLAGLHVLKGLLAEMNPEGSEKQFYFARNGYLGWIVAYVVEKN